MGNHQSVSDRVNFDDVVSKEATTILINVMEDVDQNVLIKGTVPCNDEVAEVQKAILERSTVIVYGRNCHDDRVFSKYVQIKKLGGKPKVYLGGLFEWMLLHEVYGNDRFPLTTDKFELYQYRPK